ncbi:AEC family transporter [Asticcacaulis sp. BYS171W]|uniref:AEC family transporter n=1 Tax=Asticcacaulis aquaticus TaxID=2984212 RepID=A0ABT5HRJ3_9CAUL|nr:AEC family transporter [Asticcacaulis aquaticus]MDC7682071.1 AEC family transporter [Asticcacaulis aquaticus]
MSPELFVNGILPVFLLIALGYILKVSGFLAPSVWGPIERIAVYVFYPGFLIPAIWHADLSGLSAGPISLAVTVSFLISAVIGLSLKPILRLSGPTYTSVFQGLMRFNSFVFLPIATAIFGPDAVSLAAVAMSALIPLSNMASILVLARWGEPEGGTNDRSVRALLGRLFTNPIFLSCLIGLALNFLKVNPVAFIEKDLKMLGDAAIPTGLILAGAGLNFTYIRSKPYLVTTVSMFKIAVVPLISWGLCRLFGGDHLAQGVALCCGAAPCAAVAYVQARHMGGDAPLMAGIVALTTTLSLITLPILLWLYHLI